MVLLRNLQSEGLKRILLPGFICESVVQAVAEIGVTTAFYDVSGDLDAAVECRQGDGLVVVHYFGWPSRMISGADWIIEDYSHALLSTFEPKPGHFTFFSARKFSGMNAGGWCSIDAQSTLAADDGLDNVLNVLVRGQELKREYLNRGCEEADEEAEHTYLAAFDTVESYFDGACDALAMPERVRSGIDEEDWLRIRSVRRRNWFVLHQILDGRVPGLFENLPDEVCPLGYILRLGSKRRDRVRAGLMKSNVYTAVHWPPLSQVTPEDCPGATRLTEEILTLPVDHRYGEDDMEWVAQQLLALC